MIATGLRDGVPRRSPGAAAPLLLVMQGLDRVVADGGHAVVVAPERFANGELVVRLAGTVAGRRCMLVGSVSPPEDQLASLLLVADTLKRHGAAHITAALPYLAYARQDRPEPLTSLAAAWLGRLLAASGVDALLTVDIHSEDAVLMLNATGETVVVAPDRVRSVGRECCRETSASSGSTSGGRRQACTIWR